MRVTMAMAVAVAMIVIVLVAVRVPSVAVTVRVAAMTVIMSGMSMSKRKQTNHVHQKTKRTNNEKFLHMSQLRALHHAFNSFPDEFDADEHKEDTITESSKGIELAPAVWFLGACGPFGCYRRSEPDD